MMENDTVKLLRECDAGIKMGVSTIDEVMDFATAEPLREALRAGRREHESIGAELIALLQKAGDDGKDPSPVAKGMSWMKTNMKLTVDPSDGAVADLISDGCHMGMKSLGRYLNEYRAATPEARDLAGRLILTEETLMKKMQAYL